MKMSKFVAFLGVGLVPLLSACERDSMGFTEPTEARIRVVHAGLASGAVDIYNSVGRDIHTGAGADRTWQPGTTVLFQNAAPGEVTSFQTVPIGPYVLVPRRVGATPADTLSVLQRDSVVVEGGLNVHLVQIDRARGAPQNDTVPQSLILVDEFLTSRGDTARVRIVHGSLDAGNLWIDLGNDDVLADVGRRRSPEVAVALARANNTSGLASNPGTSGFLGGLKIPAGQEVPIAFFTPGAALNNWLANAAGATRPVPVAVFNVNVPARENRYLVLTGQTGAAAAATGRGLRLLVLDPNGGIVQTLTPR